MFRVLVKMNNRYYLLFWQVYNSESYRHMAERELETILLILCTLWLAKDQIIFVPNGLVIRIHSLKIDRENCYSPEGNILKERTLVMLLRTHKLTECLIINSTTRSLVTTSVIHGCGWKFSMKSTRVGIIRKIPTIS